MVPYLLVGWFGRAHVAVELTDHLYPEDSQRNDLLAQLARISRLPVVATNAVHYSHPARGRLAAVRVCRPLAEMDGWLPPAPTAYLRSGVEMARVFRRYPGAVSAAAALGAECAFDPDLVAPCLLRSRSPPGTPRPATWPS